jgi:uncharacterized protein with NRDE domain
MTEERTTLTAQEAVELLPDADRIHTTTNPRPGLFIGANWDRVAILELLNNNTIFISGPYATRAGYGLYVDHGGCRRFIEAASWDERQ